MNDPDLEQALERSVEDVLERMFFISGLEQALPGSDGAQAACVVEIGFEGEPSGRLTLCIGCDAARSVAADFLGEDAQELSRQQVEDVIRELANMICGAVLSRVESETTFRLCAPQVLAPEAAPGERSQGNCASRSVCIGTGVLTARIETGKGRCFTAQEFES